MKYCPLCERIYEEAQVMCPEDGAVLRRQGGPPDPMIGRVIHGRYRVLRKLGAGGMGAVYFAEQITMGRPVALKVLRAEFAADDQFVRRFIQEARIAGSLRHRNVVTVHDFDRGEDGSLFLAMEYLEGQTLSQMIRGEGPLPVARARDFAIQIGEGLRAAHRAGVIHRDIKPHNIMVVEGDEAKLMDFGIARLRDAGGPGITRSGATLGTPAYMAPEQVEGGEVTERTDIYAFGAVLYEMFTGSVPFTAPTTVALLAKHLQETPTPLRARRPDAPAAVERVVMQALEKAPAARQPDMAHVLAGLRGAETAPEGQRVLPAQDVGGTVADPTLALREARPGGGPESVVATAAPAASPRPASPRWKILGVVGLAGAVAAGAALVFRLQGVSSPTGSSTSQQRSPVPSPVTAPKIDRPLSPDDGRTGPAKPPPLPETPAARPESLPGAVAETGAGGSSQLRVRVEQRLQGLGLLKRSASGEFGITVEAASDGIVTLTGVLRSGKEREEAVRVAKQVPGVIDVRQKINVAESWKIESN